LAAISCRLSAINRYYSAIDINQLAYTPAMLARLAYSHAAYELSERLVSEAATHSDAYGRGAFLTEEALATFLEAEALLEASVVADRTRGASWHAVAEALDVPAEWARERFAERERDFRAALLFPHRYHESGCLGHASRRTPSKSPIACASSSMRGSSSIAGAADPIETSRCRSRAASPRCRRPGSQRGSARS
jgi:hypothetical protein